MDDHGYRCAACGGLFTKGTTDAEAVAAFEARFPGEKLEESSLVCDDCYEQMKAAGLFGSNPPSSF